MKRDELHPLLRKEYRQSLGCGVEKLARPGFENLWFVVPPPPPRNIPKRLPAAALARANRVIETVPRLRETDELDRAVSYLFVRREAVQSSRIEGTWSTVDEALTPASSGREGASENEEANRSVRGYARALENEFAKFERDRAKPFSLALVSRFHAEIMKHDSKYRGKPGAFREPGRPGDAVFIGGLGRRENSIFNPPPARHVRRCLEETLDWMNDPELAELGDAGMGFPLVARMAIAHSHFEAVHPFPDGNGRVGRMLAALQMAASGTLPLYLSGYIEVERAGYGSALQAAQKKLDYAPIVEYFAEAIVGAHAEAEETKAAISALPAQWANRGGFRAGSAAARFLPVLIAKPIFTAKEVAETLNVSAQAASQACAALVERKIARPRTERKWARVFAAEEVVALLSKPFRDDPRISLERASVALGLRKE